VEKAGFEILDLRLVRFSPDDARRFYAVHEGKPFLGDLVEFNVVRSGGCRCGFGRRNAVPALRELFGATDPKEAKPGTIRALHAESKQCKRGPRVRLPESAGTEIPFFFGPGATGR
jgi:nucleoside-diphosphate kinase